MSTVSVSYTHLDVYKRQGESDKFIVIIGPCSADNEDSVVDYTSRMVKVQEKTKDRLIIIPGAYTLSLIHILTTGSRPLVASSRIKSFAWWDRAAALANFCFMPRELSLIHI